MKDNLFSVAYVWLISHFHTGQVVVNFSSEIETQNSCGHSVLILHEKCYVINQVSLSGV